MNIIEKILESQREKTVTKLQSGLTIRNNDDKRCNFSVTSCNFVTFSCEYLSYERDYDIENVPWCNAMSTAVEDLPISKCPHLGCVMNPSNRSEAFDLIGILNGAAGAVHNRIPQV
jgi:hypothetical protein